MDLRGRLRLAGVLLPFGLMAASLACGSSSGGLIAFVSAVDGDEEVYLLDPDTRVATPLTDNGSRDFDPRRSPSGNYVVYVSDESGDQEINLADRKGNGVTRLTQNAGDDGSPLWAPDGKRLAFISRHDGNPEVYLMRVDGSRPVRVTTSSAEEKLGDWSPDGEWLVFYGDESGSDRGLWLRNPDGVNLLRLTEEQDSDPVWSPNGQHIAFVRRDGANQDIYIATRLKNGTWPAGVGLTRLTEHEAQDLSPRWSPDSRTIAFVSYRDGKAEIYTMGRDASKQLRLTQNWADDLAPVWSPDGKRLAFISYLYGAAEVFIMDADGRNQHRLTDNDSEDHSPDW